MRRYLERDELEYIQSALADRQEQLRNFYMKYPDNYHLNFDTEMSINLKISEQIYQMIKLADIETAS